MSDSTYIGRRVDGFPEVTVDGLELDPRFDVLNRSPAGVNWGYNGAGPGQLALAILAREASDLDAALHHCDRFHVAVTAQLPLDGWEFHSTDVLAWLRDGRWCGPTVQ